MSTKKKLLIVGSVLLGIFLIVNIVWFATVYAQWNGYVENSGAIRDESGVEARYYGDTDDTYTVSISKPSYLKFSNNGFLQVTFSEPYSVSGYDTGNLVANRPINISVYFWPDMMGEYSCGVMFSDDISGFKAQVYIDKELNIVGNEDVIEDEFVEQVEKCMTENEATIRAMYQFGIDSFGLDTGNHIVD
ncbi:MAG: hypothetical protein IJF37_07370 [Lachnospiraceae bacterium]|nr:hypothetical protein [Lachnospiraceae bacterium]